jgi:hypothetical protein
MEATWNFEQSIDTFTSDGLVGGKLATFTCVGHPDFFRLVSANGILGDDYSNVMEQIERTGKAHISLKLGKNHPGSPA